MEQNEIRIGNYVLDRGNKVIRVDGWEYSNKIFQNTGEYYCDLIRKNVPYHPLTEEVEFLQPIPLTEEWFEKFGFEKIGLYDYAMPDMSLFVYWDKTNRIYLCQRCGEKIPLKYVHKLQNLYYAVKERELTIKE